jgi:hypothetical protein
MTIAPTGARYHAYTEIPQSDADGCGIFCNFTRCDLQCDLEAIGALVIVLGA